MNKFDMHFHSTYSDWYLTNEGIIKIAKELWLKFLAITDHDVVNSDFVQLSKQNGINTLEWVEISAFDDKVTNKSLHLTCYAEKFSWEILEILEKTRNWKIEKVKKQIEKLNFLELEINYPEFIKYFKEKWFDIWNLNNSHIAEFVYMDQENIEKINKLVWEKISMWDFIRRWLKKDWDLKDIFWQEVPRFEPTVDEIWKIVLRDWYFLSTAHPNFTFRENFELFYEFIEQYKDILQWIEINSLASKKWIEVILETGKKYKKIFTFWSDEHFIPWDKDDDVHWKLWSFNPNVPNSDIHENFTNFMLMIETAKKIKIV